MVELKTSWKILFYLYSPTGVSSLSIQFAKLPKGLKHLNLSKTSLSPKGMLYKYACFSVVKVSDFHLNNTFCYKIKSITEWITLYMCILNSAAAFLPFQVAELWVQNFISQSTGWVKLLALDTSLNLYSKERFNLELEYIVCFFYASENVWSKNVQGIFQIAFGKLLKCFSCDCFIWLLHEIKCFDSAW